MASQLNHYNSSGAVSQNLGLDATLAQINVSALKWLNYTKNYLRKWGTDEAFRETYQNWRDGILKSANIDLSHFRTEMTEVERVILIKAINMRTNTMAGFIEFQYDEEENSVGGLKVANFRAALPYSSLGTGATSKAADPGQTGQHGEGMKLSALVFCRNDYNFRIENAGFKWNFSFKSKELTCLVRRMGAVALAKLEEKADQMPRTEIAHPRNDVCVIVGASGRTTRPNGQQVDGKPISLSDFRRMLKVTLDVNTPTKMIRTIAGNLIRDPTHQGKMYLRGLLLPNGGMSGKQYAYGYDFVDGSTTRDRDALAGPGEESRRVADIWASAIRADDSENSDVVTEYTNLLLNHLNKKGDVVLSNDSNRLAKDIALTVWTKMRTMNHDHQGRPAFYYSAIEGKDEVHIIEQSLNQNPVPLDLELWKMLRHHKLCRTPGEELLHRFKLATQAEVPNQSFAMHVSRMLKCLLQSFGATDGMNITFVNGEQLRIDAGFFDNTWQIHNKWLTWEGAHKVAFCEDDREDDQEFFTCDHVVLHLWDVMLSQLVATGDHPQVAAREPWLKSMAQARVSGMPRSVSCSETTRKEELSVKWQTVDSYRHRNKPVRVVLHADGCTETAGTRHQPRNVMQHLSDQERKCDCPSMLSTAARFSVTFTNLESGKTYFPSVSHDAAGSFVALQPPSVKPRIEHLVDTTVIKEEFASESGTINVSSKLGSGEDPIILSDSESDSESVAGNDVDVLDHYHDDESLDEDKPEPYETIGASPSWNGTRSSTRMTEDASFPPPARSPTKARQNTATTSFAPPPVIITRGQGAQTDLAVLRTEELYVLGDQIEHRSLDWGGTFPGSHTFYRTRDTPNQHILILKPKEQASNPNNKRQADDEVLVCTSKRRQVQAFARDASTASASVGRASVLPYHRRTESRKSSVFRTDRS